MQASVPQVDWLSQEFLSNPYPHYRTMREERPVHLDAKRGTWLLTRYEDIDAVLRDDERFEAEKGPALSMLASNPPEHSRLRKLVSKAFTPRTVEALRPRVEEVVDGLLTQAAASRQFDVIADIAYPLPITIIAELLGVEQEKREFFREATEKIAVALAPIDDADIARRADEGRHDLIGYFNELIAKRREVPQEDLVSALIQAEDRGDFLNHRELLAMLLLLLVGGHETTANLIGNGLLALLRNPDQRERLRGGDVAPTTAVEELLRYDSPVQYTGRIAKQDLELAGQQIKAGQGVRLVLASANRDAATFEGADTLDLSRDPCKHLAFGAGIHFCLGAPLARLEASIVLPELVTRFPGLKLATERLEWRPAPVLRGLKAMPVTV